MKNFNQYVNEQNVIGKIIFDGDVQFESDIDWNIIIDISEPWGNFNESKIDKNAFISELIKSFKNKENDIKNNCNCWNELVVELNSLQSNSQNSNSIYNKIYDICDTNLILLKT